MSPRRTFLLAALAWCALATPAAAAPNLELGLQDDAVFLHRSYADADVALDKAVELGTDRIRVNLAWAGAMPESQRTARRRPARVTWDFSALEKLHGDAAGRGIPLQVTLTGPAPAWATSTGRVGVQRPSAKHFAAFARAAAGAFKGRIDRWSIWNEPNWHTRLGPPRSAASLYRSLFREGAKAIRAADPSADVLIGELMPGANSKRSHRALKFLREVTCSRPDYKAAKRCSGLVADGFALHPYNFSREPRYAKHPDPDIVEMGSLARLTKALDKLAARGALRTPSGGRMPVFLTEFGYFTAGPVAKSEKTQAAWLRQAWDIARRNPRVRQLLQYELIDPWPDSVTWRSAVLNKDLSHRLAFDALAELAN